MANTFRVVTFAAEPNSAGSPYTIYTVPSSTTTVVIGLILTNIHTSQVTTEVELVSTTSGGGRAATNGTSFLVKDAPIPVGSSLELLTGGKVILETGDLLRVDCSVADKLRHTKYHGDNIIWHTLATTYLLTFKLHLQL